MRVTKFTHSCLRIESDGAVLVVDPGVFSEPRALTGADAVLITHEHVDHLDVDAVGGAVARSPALRVYAHADVLPKLGACREAVTTVILVNVSPALVPNALEPPTPPKAPASPPPLPRWSSN